MILATAINTVRSMDAPIRETESLGVIWLNPKS